MDSPSASVTVIRSGFLIDGLTGSRDAATAIGKPDSLGTIEPGKEADLLLVDGSALADMQSLRRAQTVFHGGRHVSG